MPFEMRDRVGLVAEADERERRPEDLLLRDAHVAARRRRRSSGGRRSPSRGRPRRRSRRRSAALRRRPCRSACTSGSSRAPRALITGPTSESSSQPGPSRRASARSTRRAASVVVEALVDDHAARRGAPLARGAEGRPEDAVEREVEVGVVHDDDRVLAAELEVDVLETLRGRLEDLHTRLARAR